MKTNPNCKINLGLQITGKRPDGYHNLETIFLPVDTFRDELEIVPTDGQPLMVQTGIALDSEPNDNLCMKAWQLLHRQFDIPAVEIRLHKCIPYGAGLGGGSSDAAFTLKMLNEMFHLHLDSTALTERAAQLGADCAFFIANRPCYATGIGDRLTPIDIDLSHYDITILIPNGEHVSTREAYAGLAPIEDNAAYHTDLRQAVQKPIELWTELIHNDFEISVFRSHPAIAACKQALYDGGAVYAAMSGSGAAVYGLTPRKR